MPLKWTTGMCKDTVHDATYSHVWGLIDGSEAQWTAFNRVMIPGNGWCLPGSCGRAQISFQQAKSIYILCIHVHIDPRFPMLPRSVIGGNWIVIVLDNIIHGRLIHELKVHRVPIISRYSMLEKLKPILHCNVAGLVCDVFCHSISTREGSQYGYIAPWDPSKARRVKWTT